MITFFTFLLYLQQGNALFLKFYPISKLFTKNVYIHRPPYLKITHVVYQCCSHIIVHDYQTGEEFLYYLDLFLSITFCSSYLWYEMYTWADLGLDIWGCELTRRYEVFEYQIQTPKPNLNGPFLGLKR